MKQSLNAASFREQTGASQEIADRLERYLSLLTHWQRRINLVSGATLDDAWRRHILDCAQIVPHLPLAAHKILDLGSGAGLPGLIIALMTGLETHLVESDLRKCAFLREAARATGTAVTVWPRRIEGLEPQDAHVITARACAPLPRLLALAAPHLAPDGRCLFLKGRGVDGELTASEETWMMRATRIPSVSDPSGTLLQLEAIRHRDHTG